MVPLDALPQGIRDNYEVHEWRHACAVLREDFPSEWQDLIEVLGAFTLRRSDIAVGGGNKSRVSNRLESAFNERAWAERDFATQIVVDGVPIAAAVAGAGIAALALRLAGAW